MLFSLAVIFISGLLLGKLAEMVGLPRIVGMLAAGVLVGPYALNLLADSVLNVSDDLRQLALIIILLKAGLTLDLDDLKRASHPAALLSCLPALFEIGAVFVLAPLLFDIAPLDAAVLGTVLGAVSPAVVVPRMVDLMDRGLGTDKSIPQMIMAGASVDDILVIVLFSTTLNIALGGEIQASSFLDIPLAIGLGVLLGMIVGYALAYFWKSFKAEGNSQTVRLVVLLSIAFLLHTLEGWLEPYVAVSGLLAVVTMAVTLRQSLPKTTTIELTEGLTGLWDGAEILLFVLVGAAVDIRYTLGAGLPAVALISLALMVRAVGVWVALLGTDLTMKERLFTVCAYLPKATVQAAIGSVPLAAGLESGALILSVAVLAILITAPLGATLIDFLAPRVLSKSLDKS